MTKPAPNFEGTAVATNGEFTTVKLSDYQGVDFIWSTYSPFYVINNFHNYIIKKNCIVIFKEKSVINFSKQSN